MSNQVYNCSAPDCSMDTSGRCDRCGYGISWGYGGGGVTAPAPHGWMCDRCNVINSPSVSQCPTCKELPPLVSESRFSYIPRRHSVPMRMREVR